jgi:hypothetical protein
MPAAVRSGRREAVATAGEAMPDAVPARDGCRAVVRIREDHIERRDHHVLGHQAVAQRNAEATETEGSFRTDPSATGATKR